MRNAFCIFAILILLPACGMIQGQDGGSAGVRRSKTLWGSEFTVEETLREAEVVIHAVALDKALGVLSESLKPGQTFSDLEIKSYVYIRRFEVASVLKGNLDEGEIRVVYHCLHGLGLKEWPLQKGEEAILFIKGRGNMEVLKAVYATDETLRVVKKLLGKHGAVSGRESKEGEEEE